MRLELAYNILDTLQTIEEAAGEMRKSFLSDRRDEFDLLSADMFDGLNAVRQVARQEIPEDSSIRLADACICGLESLKDIRRLAEIKPDEVAWKLEYEFAPIIETMALQFFYWGIVNEYPEKEEEFQRFIEDTETYSILKRPEQEREFLYDLVIAVTAYNHLDYTIQCVQSILKNIPVGIKYELLLYNHGSIDDTKKYFESVEGARVINVAVNGVMPRVINRAVSRGRYYLSVSNDVIIGRGAIANLYRGVIEHEDYGYVVPTTPAVSNFQTIPMNYQSREEFEKLAAENNIYNERWHEQRVRLCNPLHIMPTLLWLQMHAEKYVDQCCSQSEQSFPDDKLSLWIRRKGYKCILAKDSYCHHFGSVTLKQDLGTLEEQEKFYDRGRRVFFQKYGVDPWGPGFCYDMNLFQAWKLPVLNRASVLGINCGLGANSLKVKEILRENGAREVILCNATQEASYLQDLRGVSDEAFVFSDPVSLAEELKGKKYNYIVVEGEIAGLGQGKLTQFIELADIDYDEIAYKTVQGTWKILRRK